MRTYLKALPFERRSPWRPKSKPCPEHSRMGPAVALVLLYLEKFVKLTHDTQLTQQKCIVECNFLQIVVAATGAAVAGLHVRDQKQWIVICLQRAEFGYILGRLPVHHLAVVQRCLH